ncbi:MAG: flagellar motor protein MotB, partial [Flavisolibacter sp.]|nr:flagellar motor protein MotB [Flavisolibacter sp.]
MQTNRLLNISFVLLLIVCTSCVSTKKYQAALSREQQLQTENAQLNATVTQLKNNISDLQNELNQMTSKMDEAGRNAAQLARMANMTQQQLEEEQRRLAQMRQLMDQQRQAIENLRQKMVNALVAFKPEELSVFVKNGKVYVSLQESLLFPSGSAVVNPRGKEALGKLAQALNSNPDISVLIEGHT